ncbi:hypothetical protein E5676_scaffold595G00350 [Cucumis melo var. makuwa]|uniref:Uncharacterized protein n=1 Tax=Cucumis melo var. makuwa TaxID=1194695 RepID=A0A5D3E350_CUCMM|nr:hypothetical protein E5676_scaffold595G00350 [Cucumis melo var. makuwa]
MTGLLPSDPLPGRSDRAPSSFGEVILPSMIQLLSGDDRAFAERSSIIVIWRGDTAVSDPTFIGTIGLLPSDPSPGRSDRTPSSFGEVILPSAIQLLSGDDRAFAVRSTPWIGFLPSNPPHCWSGRAPSSFREVILPSAIQLLLGTIGLLPPDPPSW